MFIKTFDIEDNLTGAERLDPPVFVHWQISNGMMVRCEQEEAQAVISEDGSVYYLINGCLPHGEKEPYAEFITEEEYRAIIDYDPEDDDPDVPDDQDEDEIMTRAELTAKVNELQEASDEKDERIEFLEDCLLEMSEVVYAGD